MVRRIYDEGLIDQDPQWLLGLATEDIEYVNPPNAVEPGVRRGPAEVVQAMRRFAEVWSESRHELHELFDCGRRRGRLRELVTPAVRGSEVELVQAEAHTWAFRDGRIARFEWGCDLPQALEAAGLSE